jgi:hypothetical protein
MIEYELKDAMKSRYELKVAMKFAEEETSNHLQTH